MKITNEESVHLSRLPELDLHNTTRRRAISNPLTKVLIKKGDRNYVTDREVSTCRAGQNLNFVTLQEALFRYPITIKHAFSEAGFFLKETVISSLQKAWLL